MDIGTVVSILIGGVITLVVSLIFYVRASNDLRHKVETLSEQERRLEFLITVVVGAMENNGLIKVGRDESGRITGLSATVQAPAARMSVAAGPSSVRTTRPRRRRRPSTARNSSPG
jgi:hypothetical protein